MFYVKPCLTISTVEFANLVGVLEDFVDSREVPRKTLDSSNERE